MLLQTFARCCKINPKKLYITVKLKYHFIKMFCVYIGVCKPSNANLTEFSKGNFKCFCVIGDIHL